VGSWARRIFERSVEGASADNDVVSQGRPPNSRPGVPPRDCAPVQGHGLPVSHHAGKRVVRKAGWDTHGLPVEIEVEKELGITRKEQIEVYGIAEFNRKCRESVFKYEKDWVAFTRRIGYWLDLERPYVTYHNEYIESVWWIIKEFWTGASSTRATRASRSARAARLSFRATRSLGYETSPTRRLREVQAPRRGRMLLHGPPRRGRSRAMPRWRSHLMKPTRASRTTTMYSSWRRRCWAPRSKARPGARNMRGADSVGALRRCSDFYNEEAAEAFRVVPGDS
jgi:hypothetical protein